MSRHLAVIVPTRSRPRAAAELMDAFASTCDVNSVNLIFGLDNDDPTLNDYLKVPGIEYLVGPRIRMIPTLNLIANDIAEEYDYIGFMGDDHRPRTFGWDWYLTEACKAAGPGGIAYGNDLFMSEQLPTAVVLDAKVVRTLGYMVPPGLLHMYADNAWKTWGELTGKLRYLNDVIIEHDHPLTGKGTMDAQYDEVWALMQPDAKVWEAYCSTELNNDVEKLKAIV